MAGRGGQTGPGYVYAARCGEGSEFKIGFAINLERRLKQHQTANPWRVTLFDRIQHPEYKEGEKRLKKLLAPFRLPDGGEETFRLEDAELTEAMRAVRVYLDEELPLRRRVIDYATLESSEEMLPPDDAVRQAFDQIAGLRRERQLLAAEQARLQARYDALAEQEDRLRTYVMAEIGGAKGIEGIATWETVDGSRRLDEESLKADEPELFEAYQIRFDRTSFKRDHPAIHEAHMRANRVRRFFWFDDLPGTL